MPTTTPTRKKPSPLNRLLTFDTRLRTELGSDLSGCRLIGVDEVGRGSLIGPVVAGAVCLPEKLSPAERKLLARLNDSKQLSAEVRAELDVAIRACCRVGIGMAEKTEVDRLNVYYASLLALYRAFEDLCRSAGWATGDDCFLLVDGKALLTDFPRERQRAVIKGDGKSAAIAAASIIAKQTRDAMVIAWAKEYPGYGWETNMGYGTPEHLAGIRQLGVTPLHRGNFRQVHQQLSLGLVPNLT